MSVDWNEPPERRHLLLLKLDESCAAAILPRFSFFVNYRDFDFIPFVANRRDFSGVCCYSDSTSSALLSVPPLVTRLSRTASLVTYTLFPHSRFTDATVAAAFKANCRIVVESAEESPLFVNKELLAMSSPYFDVAGDEIRLKDVAHDDMIKFLCFLYPPSNKMDIGSLRMVLELSQRFNCQNLMGMAEQRIVKYWDRLFPDDAFEFILFMDRIKAKGVLERILHKLSFADMKHLFDPSNFNQRELDTRDMLLRKAQTIFVAAQSASL